MSVFKPMKTLTIGEITYVITDAEARADIASNYNSSSTYAVGDFVLYDGDLYMCNTAITTAEAWNSSHWTSTSLGSKLTETANKLDSLNLITVDGELCVVCSD